MAVSPASKKVLSESDGLTSTKIYDYLRQLYKVPDGHSLSLDSIRYNGAEELFVAHEIPRLLELIQGSQQPHKVAERMWQDITLDVIGKLEECRLRMYFAATPAQYDQAYRTFMAETRALIPRKRKHSRARYLLTALTGEEADRAGSFPLARYLARRVFFWALLGKEWSALQDICASKKSARKRMQAAYSYLPDIQSGAFFERVLNGAPSSLADEDAIGHFALNVTSESLRKLFVKSGNY